MSSSRRQYPFHLIEPKWQQFWDEQQTFRAFNPAKSFRTSTRLPGAISFPAWWRATQLPPKFYILDMFPYPSGAGLHVGHPEGYTATDILARYKRAQGLHVLHPMGWDAFGLPAEQYAIKTGQHPRQTTEANIAKFKRQISSSASATTGRANLPRPTPIISSGRNGFFSSSTTRGSIRKRTRPSRLKR